MNKYYENKCHKHNADRECLAGCSAHPSNWYCPECAHEDEITIKMAAERLREKQMSDHETPQCYDFKYKGVNIDPYRILDVYGIQHPALQHLIKKALRAGRSRKTLKEDLIECRETIDRYLEMLSEARD